MLSKSYNLIVRMFRELFGLNNWTGVVRTSKSWSTFRMVGELFSRDTKTAQRCESGAAASLARLGVKS